MDSLTLKKRQTVEYLSFFKKGNIFTYMFYDNSDRWQYDTFRLIDK